MLELEMMAEVACRAVPLDLLSVVDILSGAGVDKIDAGVVEAKIGAGKRAATQSEPAPPEC